MNMQSIMAQAQKMQRDIQKKQEEINNTEFESQSGAVKLTLNGKKEIKEILIDKTILKDEEDLEALEDMIKIAFNDAIKKIEKTTKNKMGAYANINGLI